MNKLNLTEESNKVKLNNRREILFNIMRKKLIDSIENIKEESSKGNKVDPMTIEDDFIFTVIKDKR